MKINSSLQNSSIFLNAPAALGARFVTGAGILLRGSSRILGTLVVQLGLTTLKQLKEMIKSLSSNLLGNENAGPLEQETRFVQLLVNEGKKTQTYLKELQDGYQKTQNEPLSELNKKHPTKDSTNSSGKVRQKLLEQLKKLPVAPGLPEVPTHEIKVQKDTNADPTTADPTTADPTTADPTTADPISEKGRVVKNVLSALQKMPQEESNSVLDRLYNKNFVSLNNKTDAKTAELIGKEYDELQLVKEFDTPLPPSKS